MPRREVSLPDTNAILRYLLADNKELHEKAREVFEKVRTGEAAIVLLESVLVECVYVLTKFYKVPRQEVAGTLKSLLGYRGVTNNDKKELSEALVLFGETTFDIVDCILCVKAKNYTLTLFTFDKALAKKAGKG
ncbi:MAG: PIN domain-containing protein [Deltaproteobacteria bacterium]|nr:PIN domain-containing protein [Deltaproteobacteria bacterium]